MMAKSGVDTVEIDPVELFGTDTMKGALTVWCQRNGPCNYNKWQSLYFGLLHEGWKDVFEGSDQPQDSKDRQRRIKQLYEEVHVEQHGTEWKAKLKGPAVGTEGVLPIASSFSVGTCWA